MTNARRRRWQPAGVAVGAPEENVRVRVRTTACACAAGVWGTEQIYKSNSKYTCDTDPTNFQQNASAAVGALILTYVE